MIVLEIVFWLSAALIVYTHLGYPMVLWILTRHPRTRGAPPRGGRRL